MPWPPLPQNKFSFSGWILVDWLNAMAASPEGIGHENTMCQFDDVSPNTIECKAKHNPEAITNPLVH